MIWYDIKKLEHKIAENRVDDKEVFNYLLISILTLAVIPVTVEDNGEHIWLQPAEIAVSILTTVVGMKLTYDTNLNGDNKDYFRRFLALSFVTGIRIIAAVLAVTLSFAFIIYYFEIIIDPLTADIFYILLLLITQILYYQQLIRSFRNVSSLQAQK